MIPQICRYIIHLKLSSEVKNIQGQFLKRAHVFLTQVMKQEEWSERNEHRPNGISMETVKK